MAGLDLKANPRLSLIKQLILFITICQGPTEANDEYLYRFNYRLKILIPSGVKHILCGLKIMDRVGETDTLEEIMTKEEKFKKILFLLRADEYRYKQLFEDMRKTDFVGRDEYPETINGACEVLVRASRMFGGSILRQRRQNFKRERGRGGITSVMFTQTIIIGNQGERK